MLYNVNIASAVLLQSSMCTIVEGRCAVCVGVVCVQAKVKANNVKQIWPHFTYNYRIDNYITRTNQGTLK